MFNKSKYYIILLLTIRYLRMFTMLELSIILYWTEKSYTILLNDTFLYLLMPNFSDIFPSKILYKVLNFDYQL